MDVAQVAPTLPSLIKMHIALCYNHSMIPSSFYWATCQSSLSAHSFFFSVNKTSLTSLDPFPLRQLIAHQHYPSPLGRPLT
jgi:hypothetical protein